MQVIYSKHIKTRLKLRKIDYELPQKVFENAREIFLDTVTGHTIAVADDFIYGKKRDIMVAYIQEGEEAKLLTIHPLKEGQTENRIKSGRWRKL